MPAFLASMLQTALETAAFRNTYLRLAPEQCTAEGSANEAISYIEAIDSTALPGKQRRATVCVATGCKESR